MTHQGVNKRHYRKKKKKRKGKQLCLDQTMFYHHGIKILCVHLFIFLLKFPRGRAAPFYLICDKINYTCAQMKNRLCFEVALYFDVFNLGTKDAIRPALISAINYTAMVKLPIHTPSPSRRFDDGCNVVKAKGKTN